MPETAFFTRILIETVPFGVHDLQSSLVLSLQNLLLPGSLLLKGLQCSLPFMLLALCAGLMRPVQQ